MIWVGGGEVCVARDIVEGVGDIDLCKDGFKSRIRSRMISAR
jgi:hypothetical protein